MKYDNYIFDFYGTLCDIHTDENSEYLWQKMSEVYCALKAHYDADGLKEAYYSALNIQKEKACKEYLKGYITKDELDNFESDVTLAFRKLYSDKGVFVSEYQVVETARKFRALSREYIRVYSGVYNLLRELEKQNKKIYLLSNAQSVFTRPEIEMLGLDDYFDGIFISSEQKVKKPGKSFFGKLIETYGLDVRRSIMIGNDEEADIVGALQCGMDCLYIHSDISPCVYGKVKPTYIVTDGDFTKIKELVLNV